MKHLVIAAALALTACAVAVPADAQGLVGGVRRGAAEGDRVGGPVGGIVGGAVGTVNGALGIDPGRRAYRTDLRSRRAVRHHRRHRR